MPAAKRKWGSYVLPFLMGERLAARVDVKSDRPNSRLLVPGAYLEPWADGDAVAPALAGELQALAAWLGLDSDPRRPARAASPGRSRGRRSAGADSRLALE